jgi:L-fuconolactonase
LAPLLLANEVNGCVAVQADQSLLETDFLVDLALQHPFIKAVVGWVDLLSDDLLTTLLFYKKHPVVKGFRHVLQGESPEFMLQEKFIRGMSALQKMGYTYDILIFPHQMQAALQLVKQFPQMKFVIDHAAKPYIKKGEINQWMQDIRLLANQPNVHCKISGMVTEADWENWSDVTLKPYLDEVVQAFGTNRIMFGSDWPVCLLASSYERWIDTMKRYFSSFGEDEKRAFFGLNAIRFYNI